MPKFPSDDAQSTPGVVAGAKRFLRGVGSPGLADGPYLPAPASSAEELIAAIGLEPRHRPTPGGMSSLSKTSPFEDRTASIAVVTFPGAVPELSVDPGDPGDEAVGLDRAKETAPVRDGLDQSPVPIFPAGERIARAIGAVAVGAGLFLVARAAGLGTP